MWGAGAAHLRVAEECSAAARLPVKKPTQPAWCWVCPAALAGRQWMLLQQQRAQISISTACDP